MHVKIYLFNDFSEFYHQSVFHCYIFYTYKSLQKYNTISINIWSENKWELKCITKKLNKILKKSIKEDFQDKI